MTDFLPKDYSTPKTAGRYFRIQDGESIKLRVLTSPVMFWEWWSEDNKPIRVKYDGSFVKTPDGVRADSKYRFVWAMVVWNYDKKMTEIWSVGQAGIRKSLEDWAKDEDIGNPITYDIKLARTGAWMETTYTVTALQKPENTKEIAKEILKNANSINLEALITNDNPFEHESPLQDLSDNSSVKIEDVPF